MIPVIYPCIGISEKNNFNSGKVDSGEIHWSEVIAQFLLDKRVYGSHKVEANMACKSPFFILFACLLFKNVAKAIII